MPDHFHALLTVGTELTIERDTQFIKGGFAYRAGQELGFRTPVWQRGFSEVRSLDSEAFLRTSEYIRNNPVRRHIVLKPEEFEYSSAYAGFDLDPIPQGLKPISKLVSSGMTEVMP